MPASRAEMPPLTSIKSAFTSVLVLAREMKRLTLGSVSVDGSKVLANASKHKAVSYERAGQIIEPLELEVRKFSELCAERMHVFESTAVAEKSTRPRVPRIRKVQA